MDRNKSCRSFAACSHLQIKKAENIFSLLCGASRARTPTYFFKRFLKTKFLRNPIQQRVSACHQNKKLLRKMLFTPSFSKTVSQIPPFWSKYKRTVFSKVKIC